MNDRQDVIVIGGGQAGLAAGYHLARAGARFAILDDRARTGDAWRDRWSTLRLFTPARHAALPGQPWDMAGRDYPSRDQVIDYLDGYATRFALPVTHDARVLSVTRDPHGFTVTTEDRTWHARAVIVATGATSLPRIPALAAELDPRIVQLHSSAYRDPSGLPEGRVLVVGYGTSGAEIALELAQAGREVTIAGKPTPHPPNAVLAIAGGAWWLVLTRVLTRRTPIGRKVAPHVTAHGAPLIRISPRDVERAGVRHVGRVSGVADGHPVADGAAQQVDAVVWCTGYQGDFAWLDVAGLRVDDRGYPVAPFGLVDGAPGLGFVGMPFQTRLASPLLGGVGDDAALVVESMLAGLEARVEPDRGAAAAA
ncbi:NAD(P)-binding domain-containing protein [Demequina sp.]|uniref:flavin-containing monooxygenase n=1 Tax=Demequina sp. TaxID=2050685 RepID=UPI0025E3B637|nr:NAD(P)-binding domain-containing protein [Demequina sp.]